MRILSLEVYMSAELLGINSIFLSLEVALDQEFLQSTGAGIVFHVNRPNKI